MRQRVTAAGHAVADGGVCRGGVIMARLRVHGEVKARAGGAGRAWRTGALYTRCREAVHGATRVVHGPARAVAWTGGGGRLRRC